MFKFFRKIREALRFYNFFINGFEDNHYKIISSSHKDKIHSIYFFIKRDDFEPPSKTECIPIVGEDCILIDSCKKSGKMIGFQFILRS